MTLRLSVIGTGYLGATHAACMVQLGHEVIEVAASEARKADGSLTCQSILFG